MINPLTLLKSLGLVGRSDFGVLVLPEERDWTTVAPVQIWQLCWEPREDEKCQELVRKGIMEGRKIFLQTSAYLLSSHYSWRCWGSTPGLLHVTKHLESCGCRRNEKILACTGTIAAGGRRTSPEPGQMPLSSGLRGCLPLPEAPGLSSR